MSVVHDRFLELAATAIDFDLTRRERDHLADHLSGCRSCARRAAALRADARAIAALPLRTLAAGHADAILDRALRRRARFGQLRLVLLAGLLALAIVGAATVGSRLLTPPETPVLPGPTGLLATPLPTRFVTQWKAAAPLLVPLTDHTATLLPDGRVLVAGGRSGAGSVPTTQIFDPGSGMWSYGPNLSEARSNHVAIAPVNSGGEVFIVGGLGLTGEPLRSFDTLEVGPMLAGVSQLLDARSDFAVVDSANEAIVVGGRGSGGVALASVEVLFRTPDMPAPAPLVEARLRHTATLMPFTGLILVAGGIGSDGQVLRSAEAYDLATGQWRQTAPMLQQRFFHTATRLNDSRLLVVGGFGADGEALDSAEIYDPDTDTWTATPSLAGPRAHHAALIFDGVNVLVVGGEAGGQSLATSELYDVVANAWLPAPSLLQPRSTAVIVRLRDGSVMVIGGDWTGNPNPIADVEIRSAVPLP